MVTRYTEQGDEAADGLLVFHSDFAELLAELPPLLHARQWFEGNPEGALDEIEHRVRRILESHK